MSGISVRVNESVYTLLKAVEESITCKYCPEWFLLRCNIIISDIKCFEITESL